MLWLLLTSNALACWTDYFTLGDTRPADGATDVPHDTAILILWTGGDTEIDTVDVTANGVSVAGTIVQGHDYDGGMVLWKPTTPFAPGATVAWTVTNESETGSGTFTTGSGTSAAPGTGPDITALVLAPEDSGQWCFGYHRMFSSTLQMPNPAPADSWLQVYRSDGAGLGDWVANLGAPADGDDIWTSEDFTRAYDDDCFVLVPLSTGGALGTPGGRLCATYEPDDTDTDTPEPDPKDEPDDDPDDPDPQDPAAPGQPPPKDASWFDCGCDTRGTASTGWLSVFARR